MSQDRKKHILSAAAETFARYGHEKTSMADIARSAGVSRQTVYNTFNNKEEIFSAMVEARLTRLRSKIRAAWDDTSSFSEFLDVFLEMVPIAWYDELTTFGDPRDLKNQVNSIADNALQSFADEMIAAITKRLDDFALFEVNHDLTRESFAANLYWSSVNAKIDAPSRKHFISRIDTTRTVTLLLLGKPRDKTD